MYRQDNFLPTLLLTQTSNLLISQADSKKTEYTLRYKTHTTVADKIKFFISLRNKELINTY